MTTWEWEWILDDFNWLANGQRIIRWMECGIIALLAMVIILQIVCLVKLHKLSKKLKTKDKIDPTSSFERPDCQSIK